MRHNWCGESCACCTREQRIAWKVTDELWRKVVIPYYKNKILCLECFLRMASDRDITIGDITIKGFIAE